MTLAAPLAIGGARPGVQLFLAAGALVAGAIWVWSRGGDLRLPPFGGVALAAFAATLLQLLPLPAGLMSLVSPRTLEIVTEAHGARPSFLPITLDLPATLLAATRALACVAVLVVAAGATKRGKGRSLAVPLVFLGGAIALLGFVQRALGAESILGFYKVVDLPGSGFHGTFVNGNHAAALFTLAGLLGWGVARETEGPLRAALGAAALLCLAGIFATGSRFGIIGAAAGCYLTLALWLVGLFGRVRGVLISALAGVVLVPIAVAFAIYYRGGQSALSAPLTDFKVRGWLDALEVVRHFPAVGVGRGAFEAPATAFRDSPEGVRLVFPENLPLQLATELGAPVAIALMAFFLVTAIPVLRRLHRWEPTYQAAACAVFALLVHDLADFGLEVLGVALPAAVALGLVAGRRQMSLDANEPRASGAVGRAVLARTAAAFAGGVLLLAGAAWAVPRTGDADGERVRHAIERQAPSTDSDIAAAIRRHPAEHDFALLAARWAMRPSRRPVTDRARPEDALADAAGGLRQLNRAQRLFPSSPTPHVLAAHLLVRMGRTSQAAIELRLANELGASLAYPQLERMLGRAQLERAVPHLPEPLLDLAAYHATKNRSAEAARVSQRAVDIAQRAEPVLIRRAEIALATGDKAFIADATNALALAPQTALAFEVAIRGRARAGDLAGARALVRRAARVLPHEGGILIKGARVLVDAGDLAGARGLVTESGTRNLPFADRIAGEELLATIADKEGDPAAAAAARARARILVHMRAESARGQ